MLSSNNNNNNIKMKMYTHEFSSKQDPRRNLRSAEVIILF